MKKMAAYIAAAFIAPHLAQAQTDTPTASAAPVVSNLVPIPLHSGVNVLPDFMPNGGSATVILAWRDNGNAGGSDLAVIMDQERTGGSWEVVAIDPLGNDAGEPNVLYDDPHTGEDVVSTFRFARGDVDGQAATLLLTATRRLGASIPAPSTVTFKTYELVREGAITVGVTHDYFTPIATSTSSNIYCNADKALSDHFDLPLRASYAGPNTPEGCPQTTAETTQSTTTNSTSSPPPQQTPQQANTDPLELSNSMLKIIKEIGAGKEDQALGELTDLSSQYPRFAPIYFWMAVIYDDDYSKTQNKGFLDAASYYIYHCYLLDPNFIMEGHNLGAAYSLKIQRQEAGIN